MGGNSGGATAGSRFRKGSSRMGTVDKVSEWVDLNGKRSWRDVLIKRHDSAQRGVGHIEAFESTVGYRGETTPYLNVVYTAALSSVDRGKGLGMGMYLAGLKHAKDNNIGFRSDSSVSRDARKVWDTLAARGVDVVKNTEPGAGSIYTISPAAVQDANIADLNKRRKTTG